jgi:hypothetical protein
MMQLVGTNDQPEAPKNIGILIAGQAERPTEPPKLVFHNGSAIEFATHDKANTGPEPGVFFVDRNEGDVTTLETRADAYVERASPLILPSSQSPTETQVVDATGEATSSMTWPHFVERRRFSCKPRIATQELVREFVGADGVDDDDYLSALVRVEQVEDVCQATHEFIGEVGELAEMVGEHGIKVLWGDRRPKLIDECGDILFTGAWLIEAWARNPAPLPDTEEESALTLANIFLDRPVGNPLLGATDTELYRFEQEDIHAQIATVIIQNGGMKIMKDRRFVAIASQTLMTDTLQMLTQASLTANAAKKLTYQFREQDPRLQIERVMGVFFAVNFILCMANSSIEEAMIVNRKKIDARYPNGYTEGVGGGIRTEG